MTFDRAPAHLRRLLAVTHEVQNRINGQVSPTRDPPQSVPASIIAHTPQAPQSPQSPQAYQPAAITDTSRAPPGEETSYSFNTGSAVTGTCWAYNRRMIRARRTRNAQRRNAYDVLRALFPSPDRTPTPPPRPMRRFDLSNSGDVKDLIQALKAIDTMTDHLDQLEGSVNALICRANLRSAQSDD